MLSQKITCSRELKCITIKIDMYLIYTCQKKSAFKSKAIIQVWKYASKCDDTKWFFKIFCSLDFNSLTHSLTKFLWSSSQYHFLGILLVLWSIIIFFYPQRFWRKKKSSYRLLSIFGDPQIGLTFVLRFKAIQLTNFR